MKKNVLVFPCGSEIGLEIHRSLNFSTHFDLFGGSSVDDHGKFVYKNYIGNIPKVDAGDFVEKLNTVIDMYQIDMIIPAHDSVVLKLAQEKEKNNLRCEVITSPLSTCEVARSKLRTYNLFKNIIPTPKIYESPNALHLKDFPVFLKPDVGQGSKGTFVAKSVEEVKFFLNQDPSLIIQEYLPGKEYTIDCFTDRNGNLLFSRGRERRRTLNGISVNTFYVDDSRFVEIAERINQKLIFRGAWFFQLKENNNGELVLMEVAPRIAGTMALARCKGVNLVLLSLFDALGIKVDILENKYNLVLDRALGSIYYRHNIKYNHVYLDLDDLIVFKDKINPKIMEFIFQCVNKKIEIHLITKHTKNLENSLKKYKLSGLFDELIWLDEGEEKYNYIREKEAIFIDDSFSERKKVYKACGIPVFDAHMIEALMEAF
jgi:hypothetical protein